MSHLGPPAAEGKKKQGRKRRGKEKGQPGRGSSEKEGLAAQRMVLLLFF